MAPMTKKSGYKKRNMRKRNVLKRKPKAMIRKKTYRKRISPTALAMKRVSASDYLYNAYATRVSAGIGYMSAFGVSLLAGGPYIAAGGNYDNDIGSIQYRINAATSGNDPKKGTRYLIESCDAVYRITNQDNGPVEIHLFDIVAKTDNNVSPQEAFRQGLANMSTVAFTSTTLPPGIQPQMSSDFQYNFRIVKHKHLTLGQGRTFTHSPKLKPNTVINSEVMEEGNLNIRGITTWSMICISGLPTNDSTTKTSCSLGSANVDIAVTKMIKYCYVQDQIPNLYINTNLQTAYAVGESVLNIGTGTATLDASA